MNKYNIKYEVAKVYLDNIYYIEDITYNSNKLNFLVNIKKELLDNNLLIVSAPSLVLHLIAMLI